MFVQCFIPGCEQLAMREGLCYGHWVCLKRGDQTTAAAVAEHAARQAARARRPVVREGFKPRCAVEGCENGRVCRGVCGPCRSYYRYHLRNGKKTERFERIDAVITTGRKSQVASDRG